MYALPAKPAATLPLGIYGLPTSSLMHMLAYILLPLAFLLGVTHMMYGHDQPGDGFTAGVIISLAISLWYMVFGYDATREKLRWLNRITLAASGLLLAFANALVAAAFGGGFFAPVNYGQLLGFAAYLPEGFSVSSAFFFELAIALTVMGAATLIIDNLGHPRQADRDDEETELAGAARPEGQA
jgi:multicomponent K+:H+ antiporter subunit A